MPASLQKSGEVQPCWRLACVCVPLGQGGKIGGGSIDAQLGGALNNQFGLIESTGSLSLGVASINNVAGAIRALGQNGTTQVSASGLLDNGLGRIETSAQNLNLQAGDLQNGGGNVLHVGTGTFSVDLAWPVRRAATLLPTATLPIRLPTGLTMPSSKRGTLTWTSASSTRAPTASYWPPRVSSDAAATGPMMA
ncbi:hypothetical protein [Pseudomonas sp.]|uniref:hypothetical protein n=1 Tax=Pseudomonas sp. TaxID=306 RepID=UPI0028A69CA1|nr:hypothetical protein [Pseudomonas sp.]